MKPTQLRHDLGLSIRLVNIARDLFDHAIKHRSAYDAAIGGDIQDGKIPEELFFEPALKDMIGQPGSACRSKG